MLSLQGVVARREAADLERAVGVRQHGVGGNRAVAHAAARRYGDRPDLRASQAFTGLVDDRAGDAALRAELDGQLLRVVLLLVERARGRRVTWCHREDRA